MRAEEFISSLLESCDSGGDVQLIHSHARNTAHGKRIVRAEHVSVEQREQGNSRVEYRGNGNSRQNHRAAKRIDFVCHCDDKQSCDKRADKRAER